jgi:phosphoglycerol transferase MdoB-like AlkP superfamily enzyme
LFSGVKGIDLKRVVYLMVILFLAGTKRLDERNRRVYQWRVFLLLSFLTLALFFVTLKGHAEQ